MENISRGFVCVSEHKSHSHTIKATRLAAHQDVLNTFFLFLCSPLALLSFLAPSYLPEGEKWTLRLLLPIPPLISSA